MKKIKSILVLLLLSTMLAVTLGATACSDNPSSSGEPTKPNPSIDNSVVEGDFKYGLTKEDTYYVKAGNSQIEGELIIPTTYNGKKVTSIGFSGDSYNISNGAFRSRWRITSVTIPDSITYLGNFSFFKCTGLTSVYIPGSIENIGGGAFEDCTKLETVVLGEGVKDIKVDAFHGCEALVNVTIPHSVTIIRGWSFAGCKSLTSINIPNSVTEIQNNTFYNCSSLETIIYDGTQEQWNRINISETAYPSTVKVVCIG